MADPFSTCYEILADTTTKNRKTTNENGDTQTNKDLTRVLGVAAFGD